MIYNGRPNFKLDVNQDFVGKALVWRVVDVWPTNKDIFTGSASNTYRICLMGQSSLDYSWDCTQFFMVVDAANSNNYIKYKPTDADGYDVHFIN